MSQLCCDPSRLPLLSGFHRFTLCSVSAMLRSPACSPRLAGGHQRGGRPRGGGAVSKEPAAVVTAAAVPGLCFTPAGYLFTFQGVRSARALKSGVQNHGARRSAVAPAESQSRACDPRCRVWPPLRRLSAWPCDCHCSMRCGPERRGHVVVRTSRAPELSLKV